MLFNIVQNQTNIGVNSDYFNDLGAKGENSQINEFQSEINSLNEDIATFSETQEEYNVEQEMAKFQEEVLQSNITIAQASLDSANANVSSAQEALSAAKNIAGEEITDKDGNVTIDYSKRDAAVAQAQNQLETALSEQEEAAQKLEEAQEEYNQLLELISDIDSQITELDGQISVNQTQIDQLENEINKILAEENQNDTQAEENGTEIELTPEAELDIASILQLNSIVSEYTDRKDLTTEEYGQIMSLNQINTNFNNMYSQYTDQLDSEGWVDDVYNALKDVTGLGITREMIQEDFDNYSGAMKSLEAMINKDEETAKETTDNEFIRQVNEASTFKETMEVFERYYGNEQHAIDAFNKYIDKNQNEIDFYTQGMYEDVRLSKIDDDYVLQIKFAEDDYIDKDDLTEDGYVNFNMKDNEEILPIPIQGLLANGKLDIEKDKDILKEDIDFNNCYKFWTGVDYSQENVDKYNNTVSLYSQANMGIAQAYKIEQALKNTDLNTAMDVFTDLCNGNEDEAIQNFNSYYYTLIQENNPDVHTNQGNSKLTELRAERNENGEIEYVMRYESSNPDGNLSDLYMFSGYNGKDNYCEIRYNPNSMDNADGLYVNTAFYQINQDIANHNVIQERFNKNFEAQTGKAPQDVINEYFEAYETAFGHSEVQDTLNSYIEDMDTYAQKLSAALSIGSIGLSFVFPAFGIAAMGCSFVDNGIDAFNMISNDVKDEDWQGLVTNTMKEASFVMIGMGMGKLANSANTALSAKLLKETGLSYKTITALGIGTEVAIDGTLGAGFDLLTTGDLNLSGNGLNVMLDVISGIRGYKAIASQNYVKGADGTYTSFSKNGYVEYTPNGDGTYKAKIFDINDRTRQLGSQTTVMKGNTIKILGKELPWFGTHFEVPESDSSPLFRLNDSAADENVVSGKSEGSIDSLSGIKKSDALELVSRGVSPDVAVKAAQLDGTEYSDLMTILRRRPNLDSDSIEYVLNHNNPYYTTEEALDNYEYFKGLKTPDGEYIFRKKAEHEYSADNIEYLMSVDPSSVGASNMGLLLEAIQDGTVDRRILTNFTVKEGHISIEFGNKLDQYYTARDTVEIAKAIGMELDMADVYVPKFKSEAEALSGGNTQMLFDGTYKQLGIGDVFSVEGEKYIRIVNGDGTSRQLNISAETYYKLFPPVKEFGAVQNRIGNCWEVSGINSVLADPRTRGQILSLFSQEGNDIYVELTGSKSGKIKFTNGEIPEGINDKLLSVGSVGVNMLEIADAYQIQAELVSKFNDDELSQIKTIQKDMPSATGTAIDCDAIAQGLNSGMLQIEKIEGKIPAERKAGHQYIDSAYLSGMLYYDISEFNPNNFDVYLSGRSGGQPSQLYSRVGIDSGKVNISRRRSDAVDLISNPKFFEENIVSIGSVKRSEGVETKIDADKGIVSSHAYRIQPKTINSAGQVETFSVINPWGIMEVELSMNEILQNYDVIHYGKIK